MNILLLQSYLGPRELPVFPLGLAYLKASLKEHDVKAYDLNMSDSPFEELRAILTDFKPQVIGISLRNIDSTNKREVVFYYAYLKDIINVIKQCSEAKIIIGGSGFSMFAEEIMQDEPRIDYGVYLEGETTFPELLEQFDTPENVKSVFYRKDGNVVFSGSRPSPDLNKSLPPDMDVVPISDYDRYMYAVGVETKRGCALNCIYCIYGYLNGKTYRLISPEKVVDHIETLQHDYGVKRFMFIDSVFNIPKAHAENICREMISRKLSIKWAAWISEQGFTQEFLDLIREAGCDHVILSPDGFADETLRMLGKSIRKQDILNAYNLLRCSDVEISYNFFKNPPGQTLSNFLGIVLFTFKTRLELKKRIHFEFNSLRVEPHTGLYDIAVAENVVRPGESLLYPRSYTNRRTWYIGKMFDALLYLLGK